MSKCWAVLAALVLLIGTPATPAAERSYRKIVLLAGPLDTSHPRGTHEYAKSVRLLKQCLEAARYPDIRVEAFFEGWPKDESVLDDAATIVLISSGSDRREQDHPFLVGERLQVLERHMKRGCGLVLIHWSTFFPNAQGEKMLDWVGGHFDYQSGPQPRRWASDIKEVKTTVRPADARHAVCRGIQPFEVRDEFYYKIRFREKDTRLKPILLAPIEGEGDQVVAWAVQRSDGGRGFGFTGGHYFDNWYVDGFRKLVLNAIVWTAQLEVPQGGVEAAAPEETLERKPPEKPAQVTLTEGRFGEALDAHVAPAVIDPNPAFRDPPLTVECWAKLRSKKNFNVLVASDPKTSSRHWELYTYAENGRLAAYLPGYEPSEIVSDVDVCDGAWRYVALTFDGKTARLYADGKLAKEQTVTPRAGVRPIDGTLTVGVALAPGQRIGCDGLIDDVRVSRGVRTIDRMPDAELPLDPPTLVLLRFNKADVFSADPAWTPRPAVGNAASFEKETDADWVDGRFRVMDTGPYLNATFEHPSWQGKATVFKGTAIRVGDQGEAAVLFDRGQLRLRRRLDRGLSDAYGQALRSAEHADAGGGDRLLDEERPRLGQSRRYMGQPASADGAAARRLGQVPRSASARQACRAGLRRTGRAGAGFAVGRNKGRRDRADADAGSGTVR